MIARVGMGVAVVGMGMVLAGCAGWSPTVNIGGAGLAPLVEAKAVSVASQIGGPAGFGGPLLEGYLGHGPAHMGFQVLDDLGTNGAEVFVTLVNGSGQNCVFHMRYFASQIGLNEGTEDVDVAAGESVTVGIPCAEIIGLGPLEEPGQPGATLADGSTVANLWAVPAFLNLDYTCGSQYACQLVPDTNDLDGDGDTQELVLVTNALQMHLLNGGPQGHQHGFGFGMMGVHMLGEGMMGPFGPAPQDR